MKRTICLGVFGLWVASAASAGTITGTVTAKGPTVSDGAGGAGNYASRKYKFAERVDYSRLEDFVISIDQPVPEAGPLAPVTVIQRDVNFEPHVLPIVVGTTVRWPNADDIYHNVFSMSDYSTTEPPFNLGLYLKEKVPELVFSKVGQVDVFCSIHSKMHCVILVLPSRYFAKVNSGRRFVIRNVPAGTYRLKAWQERMPPKTMEVVVPAEGDVRADFTLGFATRPSN